MRLLATLLFWLCVLAYVPFHFRKTQMLQDVVRGFREVWSVILKAELPVPDEQYCSEGFKTGVTLAACSLILAFLIIAIFAGYTIYLAC